MKSARPYLSVVIPGYNEEQNIKEGAPKKVLSYLKKQKYTWEVIFVDDGSRDKTAHFLGVIAKNDERVRLIKNPHQGKAATVTTGVLAGNGDIVLFTDMDQSTPIKEIEKFFPFFKDGYDVVIGSRSGRSGAPIIRKLMAWGFVLLRTLVLRLSLKDTQVGFKAFTRKSARDIFRSLRIFGKQGTIKQAAVKAGFDLEVLFVARKRGYKIKEVPVNWYFQGTMRVSPFRDSIEGLRDLLRIRWYALRGEYR
ncbi:MAG: glycosyltransferase [bacterium]|nr:glycosyltransferase [bacterium]